jgi:hypothetical protein
MFGSAGMANEWPKAQSVDKSWFVGIVSVAFVLLALILLKGAILVGVTLNQLVIYLIFFSAVPALTIAAALWGMNLAYKPGEVSVVHRWIKFAAPYLPLLVLLYGLWGIDRTLYHIEYKLIIDSTGFGSSPYRFFLGCLAVAVLMGYLIAFNTKLRSHVPALFPDSPPPHLIYVFLVVFILSLFKPDLGHDSLSYDPYIGPASAVVLGSLPLVDTFSQYGLNYLLLSAGFKVLPWSMFSASLIIMLLDLGYYLVVALICVRLCRNKWVGALLSALLILFLVSAALYNSAYTPSVGAMRFLPSMLVLLAISHVVNGQTYSKFIISALMISSLWSLEALVFSGVVFSVFLLASRLGSQPFMFRQLTMDLLRLVFVILAPHVLIFIGFWLFLNTLPRYDIYLQLVSTQTKNSVWTAPADPAIRTWVFFGFTYALALSYGLFRSWAGQSVEERFRYAAMACAASLGIMQLSYYAGRAVTPVLVFIAFPLLILFILFFDRLIDTFTKHGLAMPRYQKLYASLAAVMLVATGGVIGDRFFREPFVLRSNATLLRECLTWHEGRKHCWTGLASRIRDKLRQPAGFVLFKGAEVSDKNQAAWQLIPTGMTLENMAAYSLAKKWLDGQDQIFLFISDSANVLFALKKRNALGLTHPMVDDRSLILRDKAFAAAQSVTEGTIIMVGDMSQQPIEMEIVEYLRKHWVFEQIDGGHSVVVYRLKSINGKNF